MQFQNVPLDPLLPNPAPAPRVAPVALLVLAVAQGGAFVCYFASLGLFSHVLRYVALPVAYATWCVLGTVGVTLLSAVLYDETLRPAQYVCVAASVPCVVGLHLL